MAIRVILVSYVRKHHPAGQGAAGLGLLTAHCLFLHSVSCFLSSEGSRIRCVSSFVSVLVLNTLELGILGGVK